MAHSLTIDHRGQSFRVLDHPSVAHAVAEFTGGWEAGTLQFFDAALPGCDRMVDAGAYVGLASLYAAGLVARVDAFEPNPDNAALFAANLRLNPAHAARIGLQACALSARDGEAPLYAKGAADSGSSLFEHVERAGVVAGAARATVTLRGAAAALEALGTDARTLVKLDVEGAEYDVLPALADLLRRVRPHLHVSFHPFNLISGQGAYADALLRLRRALESAEALACYRHLHLFDAGRWTRIGPDDRMEFLRRYLLRPKHLPRIASAQYGFVDGIGASDDPLPALYG